MAGNNDRPLAQKEDNNLRTADVLKLAATTPSSSITSSCEDTSPTVAVSAIVRSSSSEDGLVVKKVYDSSTMFGPAILDTTDDDLKARFMAGVSNVAAVSLKIGYPNISSVPHSIAKGMRNCMALAAITDIKKQFLFDGKPVIGSKCLLDLPTEIIRDHIFGYLTGFDINNIGLAGNQFLNELSLEYFDTTILITGGLSGRLDYDANDEVLYSSYLLKLKFEEEKTNTVAVRQCAIIDRNINDYPPVTSGYFSCLCEGRSIIGGGRRSKLVFEFDRGEWRPIPSLNIVRWNAAACYMNNILYAVGGDVRAMLEEMLERGEDIRSDMSHNKLNSVEYLNISATGDESQWKLCSNNLPVKVKEHSLTIFNNKLFLTGGLGDGDGKQVYQGTIIDGGQNIEWQKLPSMNTSRSGHMSINYLNKYVIVLFGYDNNYIEYFNGQSWEMGPKLDERELDSFDDANGLDGAKAVVDRGGRIIITGGTCMYHRSIMGGPYEYYEECETLNNIIVFNPEKRIIKEIDFKMKEPRSGHVAILQ